MKTYEFPLDFVWGTATSAFQTEGNNTNTNWWAWEQLKKPNQQLPLEQSGIACDSYYRYEEDFNLCTLLGTNAVRLSIEWARIEPAPGVFDKKEIEHYQRVLEAAKERRLQTFVTLHHFTEPIWFAKKGGWLNAWAPTMFAEYAKKCAEVFDSLIDCYLTINEPQVLAWMSYTKGTWPPNKQGVVSSLISQINLMRAHHKAYTAIKTLSKKPVGIVKNIVWYYHAEDSTNPIDYFAEKIWNFLNNEFFLMPIKKYLDTIGLNFYFTAQLKNGIRANIDDWQSDMGWWIYPPGLERVLLNLKKYNLPIYITENGVADRDDKHRAKFIQEMLIATHKAMGQGVNVKGYFYWSLLDNYEWHEGFWPRFGLVEVDRQSNLQRKPRPSFFYYSKVCHNGKIEV